MKFSSYVFGAIFGLISIAAAAQSTQVPNTFQPGTPAQAAQVNQNFQSVDSRINASLGGIIRQIVVNANVSGVTSAICPANSLVVSAGCFCNSQLGARNNGVLFDCSTAGNGGVAACYLEAGTFNPAKLGPIAEIEVVCLSARTNDGRTIVPVPVTSAGEAGLMKTEKESSDALEVALKRAQDAVNDQAAQMQQRSSR